MKQIKIIYKDSKSPKKMFQEFNISDEVAEEVEQEYELFDGGLVDENSKLFYILGACTILSKLEEFKGLPNFDMPRSDWMTEIYEA